MEVSDRDFLKYQICPAGLVEYADGLVIDYDEAGVAAAFAWIEKHVVFF